jgi:uncharacterized protein YukE
MSSMLEQAIVDATALREAALKNAEASIIEKYAPEIKNAVESLLEQEFQEPQDDIPQEDEEAQGEVDAPASFLEGIGGNPEDGEQVELELTLEALTEMAKELTTEEEDETLEEGEEEVLEEDEETLEEADEPDDDDVAARTPPRKEKNKADFLPKDVRDKINAKAMKKESTESDDVILDLDEDDIAKLVEELVVDITPQKSGWAGTPESEMQYNIELELASRAATEAREENEALKKAIEELSESKERLEGSNKSLKEAVLKMKDLFDEVSVSNAKLLYTNRILSSPSLNERQKENIVEAISKAGSVNEAKVIYDTLQSTGGTTSKKSMPKSLSEAIQRSSSTVLPRRKSERTTDTAIDRLQILAGIKHK